LTWCWLACRVLLKIAYLLTCRVLSLAVLVFRGDLAKDAELLVLRQDWDVPVLAPKERDLMYIGGGVGGVRNAREAPLSAQDPGGILVPGRRPGRNS
jgi:hypothetical protein